MATFLFVSKEQNNTVLCIMPVKPSYFSSIDLIRSGGSKGGGEGATSAPPP